MLYPLYRYYYESTLDLMEINEHFLMRYYTEKYSRAKAAKVMYKAAKSPSIMRLFENSVVTRRVPTHKDFAEVFQNGLFSMFSSNSTIILSVLTAAAIWDWQVNNNFFLISSEEFRDEILKIFDDLQYYVEMDEAQYKAGPTKVC